MFYPTIWPEKTIVNDGLVLYLNAGIKGSYPGTGTTWTDLAGTNNGTFLGDTTYTSDKDGGLVFDGTDDAVLFGDVLDDVFAGVDKKFTISAWLKTGTTPGSNILSKLGDTSHGENNRQFVLRIRDFSGQYRVELLVYSDLTGVGYRGYYAVTTAISSNTVYNVVISYDGAIDAAGRFTFYINNVLQSSGLGLTFGSWGDIQNGTAQLAIGGAYGTAGPLVGEWTGSIYQVMVHNRNLSASEVGQNFEATRGRFGI